MSALLSSSTEEAGDLKADEEGLGDPHVGGHLQKSPPVTCQSA